MTKYLLIICYIKKGVLNMKKIILSIISIFIIITILIVDNSKVINKEDDNKIKVNNNLLSMMLETEDNSGVYQTSTLSTWPTEGYKYNPQLSYCENGGTLTWDEESNAISFNGNKSEKCYIYFDKVITLVNYIISQYTGTQGDNNIYYHNSTITDDDGNIIDAEDNSYRYAGANADVNNYICLGSSEVKCPDDNLYRIIGVFGDNNHGITDQQLVKVIKNTSIGDVAWNTTKSNDWASASLNETLNSTFKTEKLLEIADEIAEVIWKVSGYNTSAVTAKTAYISEITKATKTHTAQIGLMYASDYGFATTSNYWTTSLGRYDSTAKNTDWLFLGSYEWVLSPYSSYSNRAWYVDSRGSVYGGDYNVTGIIAVRPSFYLNQSVQYIKGSGTISDPIYVK